MRIAMVTPEYLSWGGVGSYVVQLARNLPSDFEVHLLCLRNDRSEPRECDRITVHHLGRSRDTFMSNNQFQLALWRSFRDLNDAHHFDLVHSNHAQMSDLLLKMLGSEVPSITTVHTTIDSQRMGTKAAGLPLGMLETSERMTLLLLPFLRTAERLYMRKCGSLIFVSEFIRDMCIRSFGVGEGCRVIHNGIDTSMFGPKDLSECTARFPMLDGLENIVLFSGRMIALKGIATAIEAQRTLGRRDVHFVYAGNGSSKQWEEMARRAGLDRSRCMFIGPVSYGDMPYLYPLASAFILPSYSESFPMTVLEAMSSGTPVIASSVGGVPEMITNRRDGMLVPPMDHRALAEAISTVLSDHRLARSLCVRARDKVQANFSASVMARQTAEVYRATLEECS
ncbi:MAG TPA: glycosyltransferase family 4 protein [Methanomassiliicoccaceae archaeon]|jgi:glycosyltransferase involved in cell wall biosynthesis|nr:glycosyltransferase family 4 protein [Euryarchaeota archaeon]HOB37848.1 glycosyltransferase family 4 protein [Methanomassiliicoccaceae archaeon]HOL07153.1 glycosyltransferase family 4 protein [Methanomassiliicoccaceae archaeon]HOQ26182.1 glycosyltransferase family 4 protein [Methanomassiliicoccaceae archaeon]HPT74288.1 glycosyltransferase family 4 protein [Methanomassiliicoccaceae archaeon]